MQNLSIMVLLSAILLSVLIYGLFLSRSQSEDLMPTQPNPAEFQIERHQIEGHAVEIRKYPEKEELWIDGERRKFAANQHGYILFDNMFVPPHKTLLDAVKAYLEKHPPMPMKK
ncbi:MAG: hypothetical protein ACT4O2_07925 [Beijerinckiaceae bacterium]